jgi:hypothetical protein
MTGGQLSEDDVRAHLHGALDEVDVSARPFAELHHAVTARRRRRRVVGASVVAAVLGVGIAAGLSVTGGNGHRDGAVIQPVAPKVDPAVALRDYVSANDATSPTAVITGADGGTYAADIESGKVHVLSFDGQSWGSVAEPGSPLSSSALPGSAQPGPPVVAVHRGPDLADHGVAFQVDVAGGDAVFNGILVGIGAGWNYADFDCGKTKVACAAGGDKATTYAVDGTEVDHTFHSEPNDCTPSCVTGTRYDVTWRWDPTYGVFVVQSAVTMP